MSLGACSKWENPVLGGSRSDDGHELQSKAFDMLGHHRIGTNFLERKLEGSLSASTFPQ